MRALHPHTSGYATNPHDGVRSFYEIYGPTHADLTLALLPTWSLVHSRIWKMQIPYFARRGYRVITWDGRGNGKSDRPKHGYSTDDFAQDTEAALDEAGVEGAVVVGFSAGARWAVQFTAQHPNRVDQLILIAPSINLQQPAGRNQRARLETFLNEPPDREGWNKHNAIHWREDYPDFAQWFATQIFSEPHSTKAIDDIVEWSRGGNGEMLVRTILEGATPQIAELWAAIACPTLIIHGDDDRIIPLETSLSLQAAMPGSRLVIIEGAGHAPQVRAPVKVNLTIHDFVGREEPDTRSWRRAMARTPKRVLFVSSPIGLGHAQRDVAIAKQVRKLIPGIEIDWLAQHPVTRVLEANGEQIHPLSAQLAGESPHIEAEMTGEHELNVFQALRNMDEILVNNFHVFLDAARDGNYDLWIGDEAWEVDYYLHENPELKRAPFVWLTDFVGYLPMADKREAAIVADYNAEMIEHVDRFPHIRDLALYIGNREDIVPDRFGPNLPRIRDWIDEHFEYNGYIRYFEPGGREQRRKQFGFQPSEHVAVAAVGGTSVGAALLRRVVDAYPIISNATPDLRLIAVCGPRIDPESLPQVPGVEYRGYVHNLYEMLAAADIALVQGGLSTTMELVGAGVPFLSFPLAGHFEQNRHVAYRLERYGVPRWSKLLHRDASPRRLANRIQKLLDNPPGYLQVESGGARRAAERIARLL